MINDPTYKVSFIFALILHLTLIVFLFVKFVHSHSSTALFSSNNIINAVAVNEHDFNTQIMQQEKKAFSEKIYTVKKAEVTDQVQNILKKNLLIEQAQELAYLKKEKQLYKKTIAKRSEQQMHKILQEELDAEQKELKGAQSKMQSDSSLKVGMGAGAGAGEINKHRALIKQAISSVWTKPEELVAEDFCRLRINVAPGGEILDVKLIASSGDAALDRSAQAAVLKASPLPIPEDIKLFDEFRTIELSFKNEGVV